MPELPLCSSGDVIRALTKAGFEQRGKSKGGSHQAYIKQASPRNLTAIVVLNKKEIPRGTLNGILRQANLSQEEFLSLLKG